MATIILIRHGHNDWIDQKRLAGWTPGVHLSELGRRQAEEVGERLAALPVAAVYSSPVTRCVETAICIARPLHLAVIENEALGEVRYGEWEGRPMSDLTKESLWQTIQTTPSRVRFPGGETLCEVQWRAVTALEEIAQSHPKQLVAVVSHADVIKLALAHFLGLHVDLFQRIVIAPASVSVMALAGGAARVLRVNDDGPLETLKELRPDNEQ
ncbi:MAG: MSMEG_4193 family putative phosphomutase [Chloroflexota bacterium]